MNVRVTIAWMACLVAVYSVPFPAWDAYAIAQEQTPNIVFILADDLGWNQIGCYGSDYYETPHVDRLVQQGMKFTDAYAACPVCSPTRASIITGKYPARLHLTEFIAGQPKPGQKLRTPNWTKYLPLSEVTMAEALQESGYATGHFGKWHLNKDKKYRLGRPGDPGSQGFDDVLTTHKPGAGPPSKYADDAHHVREITERALAFIEANKQRRFFCYVTHNSIHRPVEERDQLIAKYLGKPGADRPENDPTIAAMIETLDKSIGQILEKLDELALHESTLVIFFSDNGSICGRDVLKPLRGGKADLYEGGIRVPLAVRWPRVVQAGSICHAPVTSVDFFPTFMEIVGRQASDPSVDGHSLLTLLRGAEGLDREAIYWHYPHYHSQSMRPGAAIRRGRYKLIEWFEQSIDGVGTPGALELFDLSRDVSEQRNLAMENPELARQLHGQLKAWRSSVGAQEMTRTAP